ncbi:ABC transporter permease [Hymenobacter sp. 102]|uniref:ABC transporter permease n=1 Tax=Hymenobacter sp. 102 TaxID=3403152 RepID=UPI003CF52D72
MLLSYLKIAWKVLLRRKFFTFISLFGISFTLMVLLVVYSLFDHFLGPHYPETRNNRMLYANFLNMRFKNGGNQNSPPSYYVLNRYVRTLKEPELISISSQFAPASAYISGKKLKLDLKYTDAPFWQLLEFDFLEGKPYAEPDVRSAAHVAVINEATARQYFGQSRGVVGKTIELDQTRYRVTGVVADVPGMRINTYADVWVPITLSTEDMQRTEFTGNHVALLLAKSPAEVANMEAEFDRMVRAIPNPDPKNIEQINFHADRMLASIVRPLTGTYENTKGLTMFYSAVSLLTLLFMLLPALNLVNVNISRIMERSSEIGVRKAFGATSGALVRQFLVENIFLTLLGAVLGLALAWVSLQALSNSSLVPYAQYGLNWRIFGWGLFISLAFGLLSGVYPAYKMSRMQAVQALRSANSSK